MSRNSWGVTVAAIVLGATANTVEPSHAISGNGLMQPHYAKLSQSGCSSFSPVGSLRDACQDISFSRKTGLALGAAALITLGIVHIARGGRTNQ